MNSASVIILLAALTIIAATVFLGSPPVIQPPPEERWTKIQYVEVPKSSTFNFTGYRFFEDVTVTEKVDGEYRQLTATEIVKLVDKLPGVHSVNTTLGPRYTFSTDTLAYPQYEDRYTLSKPQWEELQNFCRMKLQEGLAADEVLAHWRSIAAGNPPFGLRVQP